MITITATHLKTGVTNHTTLKEFCTKHHLPFMSVYNMLIDSNKRSVTAGMYKIKCTHAGQVRLQDRSWYCHDCNQPVRR